MIETLNVNFPAVLVREKYEIVMESYFFFIFSTIPLLFYFSQIFSSHMVYIILKKKMGLAILYNAFLKKINK